jgi:alpha-L-fucosidase
MKTLILALFVLSLAFQGFSQSQGKDDLEKEWEKMHKSKEKALQNFNEAKFGMFIHWGVYSLPAGIWKGNKIQGLGEWIMHNAKIPRAEYMEMCSDFNPVKFNADEWVKTAKMAGMKYIVFTAKHHDGFAMYDSKVTDKDIIDATPFDRDPMEELYRACQKYGINFSIYYSHATDWLDGGDAGVANYIDSHPEAKEEAISEFWLTWPANTWDPAPVSFNEYLETKAKPQMLELLQKFPGMQEVWYDVPRRMTREQSFEFYKQAYDIQPTCLINSRVGNDFGDYWIPGDNRIPKAGEGEDVFWETPGTSLKSGWGYKSYDQDYRSVEELLFWITEITSKGGNYLLNVGPTSEGLIPEKNLELLQAIGKWMEINGESVYGTTKWLISEEGPAALSIKDSEEKEKKGFTDDFTPEDFWFSAKDNYIYVTSLKWPESRKVLIKSFASLREIEKKEIKQVRMLGCKEKLSWEIGENGLHIVLPASRPNPNGYVLKIKI